MRDKIIKMLEQLLSGKYDCNDFSYDFPIALFSAPKEMMDIFDEAPEICSMYNPHKTDEEELYNDEEFKDAMRKLYEKFISFNK